MKLEYDQLLKFCIDLFGTEQVKNKNFVNPDGIEVTVNLTGKNSTFRMVEIALYDGEIKSAYMHIDDFTFEYNPIKEDSLAEIRKCLSALQKGTLKVISKNILGIKFNSRLVIFEG